MAVTVYIKLLRVDCGKLVLNFYYIAEKHVRSNKLKQN